MANVETYNLSIGLSCGRDITFRGISRAAVDRYLKYYKELGTLKNYYTEQRK